MELLFTSQLSRNLAHGKLASQAKKAIYASYIIRNRLDSVCLMSGLKYLTLW